MKKLILLFSLFLLSVIYCKAEENFFTISGTVSEERSGESILGASISVFKDSNSVGQKAITGAVTNKFGFYSIPKIKEGTYYLVIRSIGFENIKSEIKVDKDLKLNFKLKNKEIKTREVEVIADKANSSITRISTVKVDPNFILKMPSLGGESDVFRTLQLLPGIKSSSELSSGLYVRGGSADQNLILLDGVIVYNPLHLGGFLSSFNTDAIRDLKVIKGAFPAEYGGRLSSVIDLNMKEGNAKEFHGSGGVSLIASRLTLEGPINDNCSFMISGRRMYLDLLLGLFADTEEAPDYYFYDLNAKLNYKISDNDRIYASGYFCRDVLGSNNDKNENDDEDFIIYWGNKTGNLRWMHIFNPKLFSNFSLIYTNYNFNIDLSSTSEKSNSWKSKSEIEDVVLRSELSFFPNDAHTIKSGLDLTFHKFDVSAYSIINDYDLDEFFPNRIINTFDMSLFLQDEWSISEELKSNIGARLYYFSQGNYLNFEPRLSLAYLMPEDWTLTMSSAVANQYLHMVSRNDIPLPTDVWYPSTDKIKPSQAWQTVLGIEKLFNDGEYLFSVEVYYKSMKNLLEYRDNINFSFGVPLDSQFTSGTGKAYGIEFFLHKRLGDFTGWVGYTLSATKRKFAELNNGKEFFPRYDRTHDIAIALCYKLGESWELGATWSYGTGQAYTMPSGVYSFIEPNLNDYGFENDKYLFTDKNGVRLPAFHKLDLNFMYKFTWFKLPFELSCNIYNAYNRRNPFLWYIDYDWESSTEVTKKVKQITLFPIIPTFGLSFKF